MFEFSNSLVDFVFSHIDLILFLLLVAVAVLAFHKRQSLKNTYINFRNRFNGNLSQAPYLPVHQDDTLTPIPSSSSSTLHRSSWLDDISKGLNSSTFNIFKDNLVKNDSRQGLDDISKQKILTIMQEQKISFDDARLVYTRHLMNENDIDENGIPKDPKFFGFNRN